MSGGGGHGKRRHHEEEHEEHENHERWLVSYADMMTLLMVLFIVMFAISQVDQRKFAALKTGLSAGFGAPVAILTGGDQLLDPGGSVAPDSVNLAGAANGTSNSFDPKTATVTPDKVAQLAKATSKAQVAKEVKNLQEARKKLQDSLKKAGQPKGATFRFDERGLVVTIATDDVLFHSGDAAMLPRGRRILDALAPGLRKLPNRLSVDGHTNWLPISTAQYPSNWELSSARATGVLRYLAARQGIAASRLSATGFADTKPLLPRSNPKALGLNRRVEIVVVARVDDSLGEAVAELGNGVGDTTATPAAGASPAPSTARSATPPADAAGSLGHGTTGTADRTGTTTGTDQHTSTGHATGSKGASGHGEG